jgi:hypothetical protein
VKPPGDGDVDREAGYLSAPAKRLSTSWNEGEGMPLGRGEGLDDAAGDE